MTLQISIYMTGCKMLKGQSECI